MMTMSDEQESRARRQHQQAAQSSRCLVLLQRSLAIQLTRGPPPQILNCNSQSAVARDHDCDHSNDPASEHPADEMWMYDKGYNLFQGFLEANSRCWWNIALVEATRQLRYKGHCAPGVLMVGGPACALEVLRAAWARNVLRPPADHVITCLGDIEDCLVAPVAQGQFTPLPEALCWAILELTSQRQAATLDTLRSALRNAFPAMQRPGREMVYDALAKLMQERKIYHTAQGYFVVSPETRRLRRHEAHDSGSRARGPRGPAQLAGMLMSSDEAVALVHGEMHTLRDGEVTHQAVQTNLADVICGGNPNDKVLFGRCRSVPSRLERRHSLRLWGSARRLHRSGSSRSLPRRPDRSDTSSSAEYASTDSAPHSPTKKVGLLSRLFRRSARRGKTGAPLVGTFGAQYPPSEWFNPRVVHLHSVATQTRPASPAMTESRSQASFRLWDEAEGSERSATLPRRHLRRQPSVDSASLLANSTPRSSRRQPRSACSTLPLRSKCSSLSRCASRASEVASSAASAAGPSPAKTSCSSSCSSSGGARLPQPGRHSSARRPPEAQPSPQHKRAPSAGQSSGCPSPLKLTPLQEAAQNSITLQVSTKLSPSQEAGSAGKPPMPSVQSSVTLASSASSSTTISGSPGTKIYVQQNNSPMRSVITFENKSAGSSASAGGSSSASSSSSSSAGQADRRPDEADACSAPRPERSERSERPERPERPSSLYSGEPSADKENRPRLPGLEAEQDALLLLSGKLKLTNSRRLNNSQAHLLDGPKDGSEAMNNSRKLSLSLSKDALSYRNLLRQPPASKNNSSNPPSPTKSYDQSFGGSFNNMLYIENLDKQPPRQQHQQPHQQQGSEPNLDKSAGDLLLSYPSLSDMHVQFTSLAAQKILKGCPLNSVDTLVEVNMAAQDKPNNCDLTVHTDFGLV